ncbi:MAG: DNA repair protein RecN [Burkholderiales bacterium]
MLRSLSIKDYVIVDEAELEFDSGFTALTGETGAGKSILVEALALLLGDRADGALVRAGADRAELSAQFELSRLDAAREWLSENDFGAEECLLRRVIDLNGRSRVYINGRAAIVQQLRDFGEKLVEIHGQHAHQALLRAETQRNLLDAYGDCSELAASVQAAWRDLSQAKQRRTESESNVAQIAAQREHLEWQVRELTALQLKAEEWPELNTAHARLAHSANLLEGAELALNGLSESDSACLTQLAEMLSRLEALSEYDANLLEVAALLQSARNELTEAVYSLRDYSEQLELDPREFQRIDERIQAIHSSARKFRVAPEALPELLRTLEQQLEELGGGASMQALAEREREARGRYEELARELSAIRSKAALDLSAKVTRAMQKLAMSGGQFAVHLEPVPEGRAHGFEQIEFQVSAHKSLPLQALSKVASGGELSRISLAIQTILSGAASVPVMIFDEIDQGIGGRVAEILGRMLKDLGRGRQVFCVTHLPQVAASADQQWQVSKQSSNGAVQTRIKLLDQVNRIEEIARMLGGLKITETTRKHAREMLKSGRSC